MKRILSLVAIYICAIHFATAQLPNGSTAPNWTMDDINDVPHTLYDYLDNGKAVFLDFSATWCAPCWNFHNSHAFRDLYIQHGPPPGSDDIMAFMIEADEDTNTDCLFDLPNCMGGTQGNWVTGTPYPIIDNHSQNGPYNINYYPTIYGICPDRRIYEVGQITASALWGFAQSCSAPDVLLNSVIHVNCYGNSTGAIDVEVSAGTPPYTYSWSNGANTEDISNLPAGSYTLIVSGATGSTSMLGPIVVTQPAAPLAVNGVNIVPEGCGFGGSIDINITGGTPSYTYLWSNGNSGPSISNLNDGTYSVSVTDDHGCTLTYSNMVVLPPTYPTAVADISGIVTCTTPSLTLDGTGSSTGQQYTYNWTTSNGNIISGAYTLNNCVVDNAGSYYLEVFNSTNNCSSFASTAVVADLTAPMAAAGPAGNLTCNSSQTTLAGVGPSGSGYNILWTTVGGNIVSGATTLSPLVNAAGTYTLSVTSMVNGCTGTSTTAVIQNTAVPNATAQGGSITCLADSVVLSGSSTTPGVSYAWVGPNSFTSNQQNPTANTAGNYVLTVTGANGCTQNATGIVAQNTTPPTAHAGPNGVLNCNANEVVLNGSASSAGSQFAYIWTTTDGNIVSGATTLTPTVDHDGSYALMVTNNGNGCVSTSSTSVVQHAPVTANITAQTNVLCNGNSNGAATIAANGGNGTYSYAWSTGANTATVSNLGAGNYSVIVTDGEGCTESQTVNIAQPAELIVNASTTAQSAPGVNDGTASTNPQGGTGNYTYFWNNGMTTQSINGLAPGNYSVVVTDANGCQEMQSVTVNVFGCSVSISTTEADVSCHGANDGSASITIINGAFPQSFAWSNGAQTQSISDLAAGSYTVSATDGNGCEIVASVEINEPGILNANTTATGLTATNSDDGTATANPTGGVGPFTYAWSNGAISQTITGLVSANYTVSVTDAHGCTAVQTVPVAPFSCSIAANMNSTNISCFDAADGQATVSLIGGLNPFTYNWSNGATTATISDLEAGIYTVSVSDAVNCQTITEVTISEPAILELALGNVSSTDCGQSNGNATVVPTGGTPGVTYELVWSNGQTGTIADNLAVGNYTVSVTDLNNCHAELQVAIAINDSEAPIPAAQDLLVALNINGEATITASQVDNGSSDNCAIANMSIDHTNFTCNDLGMQHVILTVTDEAGNTGTETAEIMVVDLLPPTISVQNLVISLDANGEATITPQMLDNGSSDNCGIVNHFVDKSSFTCADLGQNAIVLTVKDASGNLAAGTAVVTVQDNMAPSIVCPGNMVLAYCEPVASFSIQADDNCAQNPAITQAAGYPSGNTFPVGVTVQTFEANDGHGNHTACSFTIEVDVELQVDLSADNISCNGGMDGSVSATVTGGSQGYSYLWSNGATTSSIDALGVGTYSVSVTDAAGCETAQTASISEPPVITSTVVQIINENLGQQNGAIKVDVQGGTQPYSFEWTDIDGNIISTQEDISGLAAGNYLLKVTDKNGCISLNTFTVQVVSGISQRQLEKSISLFPNPTTGFVTIVFEEAEDLEADIAVFDMTGKLAAKYPNAHLASGEFKIDVAGHADGVYLVRIMVDNHVVTKRLVIQQ